MSTSEKVTVRLSHNGQVVSQRHVTEEIAYAVLDSLRMPGWVGQIIDASGSAYIEHYVYTPARQQEGAR